MMATPKEAMKRLGPILCIALVGGCTGNPGEPVGEGTETLDYAGAMPLPALSTEQWSDATPGCEGVLRGDESYGITDPDGLVVAVRGATSVCVDTLPATLVELEQLGNNEQADKLRVGYYLTFDDSQLLQTSGTGEGEPNPQPAINGDGYDPLRDLSTSAGPAGGEPNPQPAMSPGEGEPNPQPARPAMTSEDTSTSSSGSGDMSSGESAGAAAVGGVAGTTAS